MDDLYLKLCQELSSILASAPAVDALMFRATGPQAAIIRAINRVTLESQQEFDSRVEAMSKITKADPEPGHAGHGELGFKHELL